MKIANTKQLSPNLKDIRLGENLSQANLVNKVGIRQDTVYSFELRSDRKEEW